MAATRLSDSQKRELVERFRAGETATDLAAVFGVSPNTASRAVKAVLDPQEYEQIKQQRRKGGGGEAAAEPAVTVMEQLEAPLAAVAEPPSNDGNSGNDSNESDGESDGEDADDTVVLAIDDADDFGDDADEPLMDDDDDPDDLHDPFRPMPVLQLVDDQALCEPQPLGEATLPESVYMLVDKTVELQAMPLSEVPELGRLSEAEQQRQALVMYANPRQAKRLCGRSQRVIKVPDPGILERTARYLLVQGISRVVIDGALYALPES
ncbi:MAG: hypothetical protein VKO00_04110 [Cyanobacteriota bacterium]|nr:hypothetical protein [Cyanobacteriota bacterium]